MELDNIENGFKNCVPSIAVAPNGHLYVATVKTVPNYKGTGQAIPMATVHSYAPGSSQGKVVVQNVRNGYSNCVPSIAIGADGTLFVVTAQGVQNRKVDGYSSPVATVYSYAPGSSEGTVVLDNISNGFSDCVPSITISSDGRILLATAERLPNRCPTTTVHAYARGLGGRYVKTVICQNIENGFRNCVPDIAVKPDGSILVATSELHPKRGLAATVKVYGKPVPPKDEESQRRLSTHHAV